MASSVKKFSYSTLGYLVIAILCVPSIYKLSHGRLFYSGDVQGSLFLPLMGFFIVIGLKIANARYAFLRRSKKDDDDALSALIVLIFSGIMLYSYGLIINKVREKYSYSTTILWDDHKNLWKTIITEKGKILEESYSQYPPVLAVAPVLPPEVSMGPNGYVYNK